MKILINSAVCLFMIVPVLAWGCFAPKPDQVAAPEVLIKRSKNIYLADAFESSGAKVDFKVIEILKGKRRTRFQISGAFADEVGTDFNGHRLESFWSKSGGRVQIEPNCEIVPNFQKGKRYLIFLDKPYHFKSFELIENGDDAWLKKVRAEVKSK